jgi:hypothetical protein
MACGNRLLASSLLQESFSSLASSARERGDGRRVSSSSQLRGFRRSGRAPALSVVRLLEISRAAFCCFVPGVV